MKHSVLRSWTIRPLPIALAHKMAKKGTDDYYTAMLGRLYESLPAADQARCQAELARHGGPN